MPVHPINGGGGGSGTVTSVGITSNGNTLEVTGTNPITGAGTINLEVIGNAIIGPFASISDITGNPSDGTIAIIIGDPATDFSYQLFYYDLGVDEWFKYDGILSTNVSTLPTTLTCPYFGTLINCNVASPGNLTLPLTSTFINSGVAPGDSFYLVNTSTTGVVNLITADGTIIIGQSSIPPRTGSYATLILKITYLFSVQDYWAVEVITSPTALDGQVPIGSTGNPIVYANIIGSNGLSVINGPNSITVQNGPLQSAILNTQADAQTAANITTGVVMLGADPRTIIVTNVYIQVTTPFVGDGVIQLSFSGDIICTFPAVVLAVVGSYSIGVGGEAGPFKASPTINSALTLNLLSGGFSSGTANVSMEYKFFYG